MLEIKDGDTGRRLQVAENNFENGMPWREAYRACHELGNGWRLPSTHEMSMINDQLYKKRQGSILPGTYWTSMAGIAFMISDDDWPDLKEDMQSENQVRPVRNF